MKYSWDKQQWYLNSFLLARLWEELHKKKYVLKVLICNSLSKQYRVEMT
jgi:hypothetical protein